MRQGTHTLACLQPYGSRQDVVSTVLGAKLVLTTMSAPFVTPHSSPRHDCDVSCLAQFTEAKILSEFIKTDAYKMEVQARPPMAVTNAVSWRSEGIKYKKNEVRPSELSAMTMRS